MKRPSNIQCRLWIMNYAKHAFKGQCCGTSTANKADLDVYPQRIHDAIITSLVGQNDVVLTKWWRYYCVVCPLGELKAILVSQKNVTRIRFENIHLNTGKQSSRFDRIKSTNQNKSLFHKNRMVSDPVKVCHMFNDHFINLASDIGKI